ncbi:hypothetical protein YC2023_051274 [Brassica napus]
MNERECNCNDRDPMDYVRGRGLRDVWASDATLIVRAGVQRRMDLRCYLCGRVVQRRLYHGRYLRGRGVQRHTVLATLRIIYPYEEMRGWEFYLLKSVVCVFSIPYLTE